MLINRMASYYRLKGQKRLGARERTSEREKERDRKRQETERACARKRESVCARANEHT